MQFEYNVQQYFGTYYMGSILVRHIDFPPNSRLLKIKNTQPFLFETFRMLKFMLY